MLQSSVRSNASAAYGISLPPVPSGYQLESPAFPVVYQPEKKVDPALKRDELRVVRAIPGANGGKIEFLQVGEGANAFAVTRIPKGESLSETVAKLTKRPNPPSPKVEDLIKPGGKVLQEPDPSNNCHYHALCCEVTDSVSGKVTSPAIFDKPVYVDGQATILSLNKNPVEMLLAGYFTSITDLKKDKVTSAQLVNLVKDKTIKDGDAIVFETTMKDKISRDYVHSGIVRVKEGEVFIDSKLGEGAVVLTPIENLTKIYDLEKVSLWRRK